MSSREIEPAAGYGWRAVVPATSANLGCAFDCGGLALDLHLQALFVPGESDGLSIEYKGKTTTDLPLDSSNLVPKALSLSAERLGQKPPAGHVIVESEIPIGVGLGSSAAAVIAGLLLGAQYSGQQPPAEQLLRWAEELEGHLDNAAAAYHGGLVFALCNNVDKIVTLKAAFPEAIRLVVVSPAVAVSTHVARQVLPAAYARADVLHTLQRTALLAATCFSGRFELFPELFDDRLHHPFRQKLVPGIEPCLRLRRPGLLGVAISGSGSSVIAFAESGEAEIADELRNIFSEAGVSSETRITRADNNGAWVTRQAVPLADRLGRVLQKVEKVK
ncbi:MAG TPA: homoserine kinase [Candidatus Angelobacter sp.]|nr:homoserine kinase [Candidatus Angelobacter sp.]